MSADITTVISLMNSGANLVKHMKSLVDTWGSVSKTEKKVMDDFIYFLSDRRVLYRPIEYEVMIGMRQSVYDIRREIIKSRNLLDQRQHSETRNILETLRQACVTFIEVIEKSDNIEDEAFKKALTDFRIKVRFWIELVAGKLLIDISPEMKLSSDSY